MTVISIRKNLVSKGTRIALVALVLLMAAFATSMFVGASAFAADSGSKDMHRVYNPNSGEHFYTSSVLEKDDLVGAGWLYEGTGWVAPQLSSTPVYRLYSGTDHHYTKDAAEKSALESQGWKYEGIGWYSSDDRTDIPLYRQFNPNVDPSALTNNSGSHNYTTSQSENDSLINGGWKGEGVGWYAIGEGQPVAHPVQVAPDPAPAPTPAQAAPSNAAPAESLDSVLVTRTGSKYHRLSGCRSTANSRNTSVISLAEAQRRGLGPCSNCFH